MNKIDFPIGVELPMLGGGIAVLLEFAWGHWWGRHRETDRTDWVASKWYADGSHVFAAGDLDIRQPKRKAWVAWRDGEPPKVFMYSSEAPVDYMKSIGWRVQEITEP